MKRVLVAGYGQFEWFAPAWGKGLEKLGLDVAFVDFSKLFSPHVVGRVETRFMWGPAIRRINLALQSAAARFKPEGILIHNGNPIRSETVRRLTQESWVAGYHHDDPFGGFGRKAYFRLFRRAIPSYGSHHVVRQENVPEYQQLGARHVRLLMRYYVPWLHYPPHEKAIQQPHPGGEVVFIGHAECDQRIQYVKDLVEAGVRLRILGARRDWQRHLPAAVYTRLPPIHLVTGNDYPRAVWGSKICLAFFSQANRDQYAYRVFEIPACGGFLLAHRTEVMQSLYQEGTEAEYFESSLELIDKVHFYLRHEQARRRIAMQGYRRCLSSGYDVLSRMKQWVADIQEFRG